MIKQMSDVNYRSDAFKRVFGSPEGKDVLDFLEATFKSKADFTSQAHTYYTLGEQHVIDYIKQALEYERKIND